MQETQKREIPLEGASVGTRLPNLPSLRIQEVSTPILPLIVLQVRHRFKVQPQHFFIFIFKYCWVEIKYSFGMILCLVGKKMGES